MLSLRRPRSSSAAHPASPKVESLEPRQLLNAGRPSDPEPSRGPQAEVQVLRQQAILQHRPASDHAHPGPHLHGQRIGHILMHRAHEPRRSVSPPGAVRIAGAEVLTPQAVPALAPYTPGQIRHAYGFDQLGQNGAGQTIAIVAAYDDPTIANDLRSFDQTFGLPDPPSFTKVVPATGTPAYNTAWAGEIALDVEWAHAIAPGASILLVEARSSSSSDMMSAVDTAVAQGARQVSMSFVGAEVSYESYYDYHFKHPGVTFLAAAGDNGAGVGYPAASPYVISVGGTSLQLDGAGNRLSETAWAGGGGGPAGYEARPAYQAGFLAGSARGVPDVAYDADPSTGYYVYDSSSGGAWYQVGGTSAGAPQWAGLIALANQGRAAAGKASLGTGLTFGTNALLYQLAGGTSYTNPRGDFNDIVAGSNGYLATPGYDLTTGLGSPAADRAVGDLINA